MNIAMYIGIAIGVATAVLLNRGKRREALILFGVFTAYNLCLVTYVLYMIWSHL